MTISLKVVSRKVMIDRTQIDFVLQISVNLHVSEKVNTFVRDYSGDMNRSGGKYQTMFGSEIFLSKRFVSPLVYIQNPDQNGFHRFEKNRKFVHRL